MNSHYIKVRPNPISGVLIRRGESGYTDTQKEDSYVKTHTHIRIACEDRSRDLSDASASQGEPQIAGNHQRLGETDCPSESSERINPADTSISDFKRPEL